MDVQSVGAVGVKPIVAALGYPRVRVLRVRDSSSKPLPLPTRRRVLGHFLPHLIQHEGFVCAPGETWAKQPCQWPIDAGTGVSGFAGRSGLSLQRLQN